MAGPTRLRALRSCACRLARAGDWCSGRIVLLGRPALVRTRCVCGRGCAVAPGLCIWQRWGTYAIWCDRSGWSVLLSLGSSEEEGAGAYTATDGAPTPPPITSSLAHADVVQRSAPPAAPLPPLFACVRLSFAPFCLAPRGCAAGPWPWPSHARWSRPRMALAGTDAATVRAATIRMRSCSVLCAG